MNTEYKIEKHYVNDGGIKVKFCVIAMDGEFNDITSELGRFDSYSDAEEYIMGRMAK